MCNLPVFRGVEGAEAAAHPPGSAHPRLKSRPFVEQEQKHLPRTDPNLLQKNPRNSAGVESPP